MVDTEIQHFLVIYDVSEGMAKVKPYGVDYEAAMEAYVTAEEEYRNREDIDVVLLGADSEETIRRTHSSYFDTEVDSFERLLPDGVLDRKPTAV